MVVTLGTQQQYDNLLLPPVVDCSVGGFVFNTDVALSVGWQVVFSGLKFNSLTDLLSRYLCDSKNAATPRAQAYSVAGTSNLTYGNFSGSQVNVSTSWQTLTLTATSPCNLGSLFSRGSGSTFMQGKAKGVKVLDGAGNVVKEFFTKTSDYKKVPSGLVVAGTIAWEKEGVDAHSLTIAGLSSVVTEATTLQVLSRDISLNDIPSTVNGFPITVKYDWAWMSETPAANENTVALYPFESGIPFDSGVVNDALIDFGTTSVDLPVVERTKPSPSDYKKGECRGVGGLVKYKDWTFTIDASNLGDRTALLGCSATLYRTEGETETSLFKGTITEISGVNPYEITYKVEGTLSTMESRIVPKESSEGEKETIVLGGGRWVKLPKRKDLSDNSHLVAGEGELLGIAIKEELKEKDLEEGKEPRFFKISNDWQVDSDGEVDFPPFTENEFLAYRIENEGNKKYRVYTGAEVGIKSTNLFPPSLLRNTKISRHNWYRYLRTETLDNDTIHVYEATAYGAFEGVLADIQSDGLVDVNGGAFSHSAAIVWSPCPIINTLSALPSGQGIYDTLKSDGTGFYGTMPDAGKTDMFNTFQRESLEPIKVVFFDAQGVKQERVVIDANPGPTSGDGARFVDLILDTTADVIPAGSTITLSGRPSVEDTLVVNIPAKLLGVDGIQKGMVTGTCNWVLNNMGYQDGASYYLDNYANLLEDSLYCSLITGSVFHYGVSQDVITLGNSSSNYSVASIGLRFDIPTVPTGAVVSSWVKYAAIEYVKPLAAGHPTSLYGPSPSKKPLPSTTDFRLFFGLEPLSYSTEGSRLIGGPKEIMKHLRQQGSYTLYNNTSLNVDGAWNMGRRVDSTYYPAWYAPTLVSYRKTDDGENGGGALLLTDTDKWRECTPHITGIELVGMHLFQIRFYIRDFWYAVKAEYSVNDSEVYGLFGTWEEPSRCTEIIRVYKVAVKNAVGTTPSLYAYCYDEVSVEWVVRELTVDLNTVSVTVGTENLLGFDVGAFNKNFAFYIDPFGAVIASVSSAAGVFNAYGAEPDRTKADRIIFEEGVATVSLVPSTDPLSVDFSTLCSKAYGPGSSTNPVRVIEGLLISSGVVYNKDSFDKAAEVTEGERCCYTVDDPTLVTSIIDEISKDFGLITYEDSKGEVNIYAVALPDLAVGYRTLTADNLMVKSSGEYDWGEEYTSTDYLISGLDVRYADNTRTIKSAALGLESFFDKAKPFLGKTGRELILKAPSVANELSAKRVAARKMFYHSLPTRVLTLGVTGLPADNPWYVGEWLNIDSGLDERADGNLFLVVSDQYSAPGEVRLKLYEYTRELIGTLGIQEAFTADIRYNEKSSATLSITEVY